jgi:hypothetical protein
MELAGADELQKHMKCKEQSKTVSQTGAKEYEM